MFERFTDRARRVVVLAEEEARMMPSSQIGTEHLVIGMLAEGEGVAAQVLAGLGVTLEAARQQAAEILPPATTVPQGHMPFTPRAKRVLELSLREALQLGHNYLGTEHMLLGLVREGEGPGVQILERLGHSGLDVHQAVMDKLHGYGQVEAPRPGPRPVATLSVSEPARAVTIAGLAKMIADLDGYIERQAAEFAAPAIREAKAETLRQADLVAELRRTVTTRDRVIDGLREDLRRAQGDKDD